MADSSPFDPYHKWLGIPPDQQPPNHYQLLRIELFESDTDVIEHTYNKELKSLEQYKEGEHADQARRLCEDLEQAHRCLLNPTDRAAYDAQLRSKMKDDEEAEAEAKQQARKLAIQQAVKEAQAALTAEMQQLQARIDESAAREQEAMQTAAQLRQQLAQAGKSTL